MADPEVPRNVGMMARQMRPRSLADDLRSRSQPDLRALVSLRPDLVRPWPADMGQLARHAADDASVLEAMQSLTLAQVRLLEVAVALDDQATAAAVAEAVGQELGAVLPDLARLWDLALLWGAHPAEGEWLHVIRAAQQAFGPWPCGLGPLLADTDAGVRALLGEPAPLLEAAGDVPPAILRSLVWESPVLSDSDQEAVPMHSPLLVARTHGRVLAREVSMVLRQGRYFVEDSPPPQVGRDRARSDSAGGHAAGMLVAGVRHLVRHLTRQPLAWRRGTGVSRRALTDLSGALRVPEDDVQVWLEVAAAAGLIGSLDTRVGTTRHAAAWQSWSLADQWAELIAAWLGSDRPVAACGVGAGLGLLTDRTVARSAMIRGQVLDVWPVDRVISSEDLRILLDWHRPRLHRAQDLADGFYHEIHAVGLAEAGAATAALPLVLADPQRAARQLFADQAEDELIVQPDLTVIAPAVVERATSDLLDAVADLESWGPATVHRISPARVAAAVEAGDEPEVLLRRLRDASRTPLPQALEYLVRDARRGAQPLRLHMVSTVVCVSEPEAADDLTAVGLREVAPGVWIGAGAPRDVASALEQRGRAVHVDGPMPEPAEPFERPVGEHRLPDPLVTRLVGHLVDSGPEGDPQARPVPDLAPVDVTALLDLLEQAVVDARDVWLRSVDPTTGPVADLVAPMVVGNGTVSGFSRTQGHLVTIPLSRVAGFAWGGPA